MFCKKAKGFRVLVQGVSKAQAPLFASHELQIFFIDFTPGLFILWLAYVSSNHKPG